MFYGTKLIFATSMTRKEYNDYCGWDLPSDECGEDSGFLVEYANVSESNHPNHSGYISWSPSSVFEESYQECGCLSFGHAIEAMKRGEKVSRAGWNGKGMWVIYNKGSEGQTHAMFDGSVYKKHGVDACEILPHFDMYTINAEGRRAMLPGWLASQSDMNANDWGIV